MKFLQYFLGNRPSTPPNSPTPTPQPPTSSTRSLKGARRYLSNRPGLVDDWLRAARDYVRNKPDDEKAWLYRKPYDPSPGNHAFFTETYQVLNLLQAMAPTPGGRIVEVGSGPGWVTEILLLLGYEVDGIEPSEDMIEVARERIEMTRRHYRLGPAPAVRFHAATLEDCDLPDEGADAVLFHESLHHVIDERRGLEQCFRMLRPGGVVGVSEWAWHPGDSDLEAQLEEEMERYGTLENPYTPEYLERLLTEYGFADITRFHGVNGFIPIPDGDRPVHEIAQAPAHATNNLIARKPAPDGPTTADRDADTRARIEIVEVQRNANEVRLRLRLTNTGQSVWLHAPRPVGQVQVALRSERLEDRLEGAPRRSLPRAVRPKETVDLTWAFPVPPEASEHRWFVDLVDEGLFWFSTRGTETAEVDL